MTTIDMRNIKKIVNPSNNHVYKKVTTVVGGVETVLWKGTWKYTINIGDYVSKIKYSTDGTNWTETISNVTVEVDSGKTLYIQTVNYDTNDVYWAYTQYNFNISRTESNAGGSVTIYQTRSRIYYTSTIQSGNYVYTVRAKVGNGSWTSASSSVTVSHLYEDTVYYEAVSYDTSDAQYTYSGALYGNFTNSVAQTVTISQTRTVNTYTVTISGTRCSANRSSGTYEYGTVITWTANTNCAFNSSGTQTTSTATITGAGTYSKSANYVYCTTSGTHCSADKTGWMAYGETITWTADTAYCFDTSNTTTTTDSAVPNSISKSANYVKRYTLTINVINSSYGSYSVSRTSSPYAGASTGVLNNGATIYYGDVLSCSATPNPSSTTWDVTSLATPSLYKKSKTSSNWSATVKNEDSHQVTMQYSANYGSSWTTISSSVASGGTATRNYLTYGSGYYFRASYYRSGTKYTYSVTTGWSTVTVTGNTTATITFSRSSTTVYEYLYSSNLVVYGYYEPEPSDFYIQISTYDDGGDENYYQNYLEITNNFPEGLYISHIIYGGEMTDSGASYSAGQKRQFGPGSWCEEIPYMVRIEMDYDDDSYTFEYEGSELHHYWR